MNIFIRNNWKWLITTVITFIAVLLPAVLFWAGEKEKVISYDVKSSSPLVLTENIVDSNLKITFNDQPLKKAYLSVITIKNTGAIAVRATDFESPIKIQLGEGVKAIDSVAFNAQPESLEPELENKNSTVSITPILLNPEDSISIRILTSDKTPDIKLSARIAGIKKLTPHPKSNDNWDTIIIIFYIIWILLIFICYSILTTALIRKDDNQSVVILTNRGAIYILIVSFAPALFVAIYVSDYFDYGLFGHMLFLFVAIIIGEIAARALNLIPPKKISNN